MTTPPRVTPAASSVEIAYQNAFARLDAALRARDDSLSDIYSDDNAGAPPEILSELETVHSNNSKVSKVTETALAFLSQTDDSATHDVESVRIEAASPAPTTHLHHDEGDEDLISFDEDPTPAGTIPITIADGFPPTSTFAKEVEEVESGNVALDVNPTTDHSVESGTELPVKTSEDVPFFTKGTTSAPDDGLTVAAEAQCAAISITGDDTVTPPASVHEDDNVVKCFKCANDCVENVITCACNHQYCADCLNDMVKASIHGPTPFPPVCCEIPILVDINSSVFEKNTLYDFLWKKFGASDVGEQGGVSERGEKSLPSLPSLPSLSIEEKTEYSFSGFGAEEAYNETKCHLCHKTIEKGLYCPDCCYQCNNSRAACKCDWWDGRQRREKGEAIVKAPSFQTAQPQVAPFRGQRKQFEGIFECYNGTRRAETQNGACQHPLMKQVAPFGLRWYFEKLRIPRCFNHNLLGLGGHPPGVVYHVFSSKRFLRLSGHEYYEELD
ncbi:Zinc finger, RING-type, conserved site [Fusarium oxysporum f. sp. vasinfectum]|nr:Zinc finger, RING-type, conserved site [Fusarium oxysporum f. sp. vasinfectum]